MMLHVAQDSIILLLRRQKFKERSIIFKPRAGTIIRVMSLNFLVSLDPLVIESCLLASLNNTTTIPTTSES